jgi:phosphate:Na+ symporter
MNGLMTAFAIAGGLALFIFGMHTMTEGLRGFAGANLRRILARATRNRLNGTGLGTLIGFLVQSSASTVMLVGFINAGLMTLNQSVSVMLGANIGTTLSMQLISFKLADYCFLTIALGFLIRSVVPKPHIKAIGTALLGFGLLFLGMSTMSGAIAPYRETFIPVFEQIDGSTAGGMIRGILLATLVTGIIQSSGAVIGMTFALIEAGVITDLPGAFPIIIGANIGTCVTALLGSIGTHIDARRSAISHLVFNIFSTAAAALTAPLFFRWVPMLGNDLVHQAANANTIKMVITALIVLPFAPLHAALVRKLVPSRKAPPQPSFLDEDLIPKPEQALHAAMRELRRMTELCRESLVLDEQLLDEQNTRAIRTIQQNEKTIDAVKLALSDYLTQITSRFLSHRQAVLAQHLDRCMTEIERIGDHLKVLCKLNAKIAPYGRHAFFAPYRQQLKELYVRINRLLGHLSDSLDPEHESYEETARKILADRKEFIEKKKAAKKLITGHVGRDEMPPLLGIYLNEYQMTFNKIARHCKVIAGEQQSPFFWLKLHKLDRSAEPYSEKDILDELDESDLFDTL